MSFKGLSHLVERQVRKRTSIPDVVHELIALCVEGLKHRIATTVKGKWLYFQPLAQRSVECWRCLDPSAGEIKFGVAVKHEHICLHHGEQSFCCHVVLDIGETEAARDSYSPSSCRQKYCLGNAETGLPCQSTAGTHANDAEVYTVRIIANPVPNGVVQRNSSADIVRLVRGYTAREPDDSRMVAVDDRRRAQELFDFDSQQVVRQFN